MGEMADYELDDVMDEEEARFDYRIGNMSLQEALDRGIVNEQGGEDKNENRKNRSFMYNR